jgi:hypothetical protein
MIKNLLFIPLLALLLLLIQLFLPNYVMVCIAYFFTGALIHALHCKLVYIKTLITQLIITGILYYTNALPTIQFLENTLQSFDLPAYILPLAFILFNSLNAAIIVNLGAVSVSIIKE